MSTKTKLELTWIGKDERPRLEPRILLPDLELSYGPPADNRIIFGDNLLALKSLEAEFTGKIKCICIDPPYNTGSAFDHYDDSLEHSTWLSLIRERLTILRRLLTPDGTIWVCIDDNESAYLRVMMDEIFGRDNFSATIVWEKRTSRENRRAFSFKHDYILAFSKNRKSFEANRNSLPLDDAVLGRYKNPDDDPRGPWQSVSANAMGGHATANQFYDFVAPSGKCHTPPAGRCWTYTLKRMNEEVSKGNIWFGKDGNGAPRVKKFLSDNSQRGLTPETIWYAKDVGTNDGAKKSLTEMFGGKVVFDTPKPEGLIERIIHIATNPGDYVLDSFAGSGTTGAAAHKMNRRWIMVELGEQCHDVIIPRMKKVIDGEDPGGITEAVGWKGGGGFRYFRLAPSLLKKDRWDNWVISDQYNPEMLTEALCKLEGFTYAPSDSLYWQHGHSTEQDFVYVTTQTLTRATLEKISADVGEGRTLLVLCKAFRGKPDFDNLTVKKIPKAVMTRCEWSKDDYSLNVAPPATGEEDDDLEAELAAEDPRPKKAKKPARRYGKGAGKPTEGLLFDDEAEGDPSDG